jgi:hypothetical protein
MHTQNFQHNISRKVELSVCPILDAECLGIPSLGNPSYHASQWYYISLKYFELLPT